MNLRTPYYLIDERRLQHNLEIVGRVREDVRGEVGARPQVLLHVGRVRADGRYLDGTTSSSLYEARLGREQFGKEVHAYSVAWNADELAAVAEVADKVIFNSVAQLRRHRGAVGGLPLGLRVNPGISYSHFDLADPARKHSRLGVTDDAELRDVAADLSGLMFHFNCENEDFDALATAVNLIAERYGSSSTGCSGSASAAASRSRPRAIRSSASARCCATSPTASGCRSTSNRARRRSPARAELVTTVLDVVHNEVEIAVVDASIEAHMLDHLIYGTHPRVDAPSAGHHPVTIAGRTCLAGDVFGEYGLEDPLRSATRSASPTPRATRWSRPRGSTDCGCRRSSCVASTAPSRSCASSGTTISSAACREEEDQR